MKKEECSMQSLQELYKIGRGPSSSHTIGPERAARRIASEFPQADRFRVVLYGSLARTGRGHMTDRILTETLPVPAEVEFDLEPADLPHPNTLDFFAYRGGELLGTRRVMSVGGGTIRIGGETSFEPPEVYSEKTFSEIAAYCDEKSCALWEYVERREGPEIWDYLRGIWAQMQRSIEEGLSASGKLEGGLGLQRKARYLYRQHHMDESPETRENRIVCAYAFAVSEQNASLGTIVTAPTCGASGVLPAVLRYAQERRRFSDEEVLHALAVAGVIGNLVKTNASISGAECGCQAEIGTACSMAAAALAELYGMELPQIEYAAEVAMEHHLGLTCDPVGGLVQIPCIERNAVAAMRAINAVSLANFLTNTRKISFDMVVETMARTGKDMSRRYRETAEGGLALLSVRE